MKTSVVFHRNGKRSYFIDGREVSKRKYDAAFKKRGRVGGSGVAMVNKAYSRPFRSRALGVHRSQVAEMNALMVAEGNTGCRFLPSGEAEFSSREARRKELRRSGLIDNDGGYSD